MNRSLKKVFHEKITVDEAVQLAVHEISEVFNKTEIPIEKDNDTGFYGDIIGTCPLCGADVKKNKYAYGCTNYQVCKFKINFIICKRIISKSNATLLLKTGKTSKIEGFISKNGKEFSGRLKLSDDKIVFDFN